MKATTPPASSGSPQRPSGNTTRHAFLVTRTCEDARIDLGKKVARRHHVDVMPLGPSSAASAPGHPGQSMLARHIGGDLLAARDRERRTDIDDAPIAIGDHETRRLTAEEIRTPHIRGDHLVPCRSLRLREGFPGIDAGVVDENIETTFGLADRADRGDAFIAVAEIESVGLDVEAKVPSVAAD